MFIFKSNMDKDFDQICEYILKLKRAELFLHGIKQQDKTKARLYHAMLEYYDANHKKERQKRKTYEDFKIRKRCKKFFAAFFIYLLKIFVHTNDSQIDFWDYFIEKERFLII